MIVIDTDVLIEIFDKKSGKADQALRKILQGGEDISITADVMIAAIAINNAASLYTLDQKHFKPLKTLGLKLVS